MKVKPKIDLIVMDFLKANEFQKIAIASAVPIAVLPDCNTMKMIKTFVKTPNKGSKRTGSTLESPTDGAKV